jgi:hypothetical protein
MASQMVEEHCQLTFEHHPPYNTIYSLQLDVKTAQDQWKIYGATKYVLKQQEVVIYLYYEGITDFAIQHDPAAIFMDIDRS